MASKVRTFVFVTFIFAAAQGLVANSVQRPAIWPGYTYTERRILLKYKTCECALRQAQTTERQVHHGPDSLVEVICPI